MYNKRVEWDLEVRSYACYLDNELVGFTTTYELGLQLLDQLVIDLAGGVYWRNDSDYH